MSLGLESDVSDLRKERCLTWIDVHGSVGVFVRGSDVPFLVIDVSLKVNLRNAVTRPAELVCCDAVLRRFPLDFIQTLTYQSFYS